ncbi:RNA-directed DNA polymerase, eukaryota [Tanacetum coccineum]
MKHHVNFVSLQETKMESMELVTIKTLWGNSSFDYALSSSLGNSGGILCVWEPTLFVKDNVTSFDNFLAVMGTWVPSSSKLLIISVYAPQDLTEKRVLWDYILRLIDRWDGDCVIMGDFNEVRTEQERYGLVFNVQGANAFNSFISLASLFDLPLDGHAYTWAHKTAIKMCKLHRFLVSKGLLASFPFLSALFLDRNLSDHRPILMRELSIDYGHTPFRFFHSWFNLEGFDKMIEDTWKKLATVDSNEGDENTKFFQSILNSKRSQLAIRETLVDVEWIVDPLAVKSMLSFKQQADLERNVSNKEIKSGVWDCGTNKSPEPDGFTFEFFRRYWKLLEHDIVAAWCSLINGCLNSALGSVLVNGSPTSEFQFHKDLKQGDPLFPFLFILMMESLNLSFSKVTNAGLFSGIPIDSSLTLSHLFFTDDAIFVGKWDSLNMRSIVNVLKCFHLALGLKINFQKSKLIGIDTRPEKVDAAATTMGCSIFTTPFVHLGVKVGGAMSRIKSWDDVVSKVSSRLSKWKLKTLSIDITHEVTVLRTKGINLLNFVGPLESDIRFIKLNQSDSMATNCNPLEDGTWFCNDSAATATGVVIIVGV